MSNPCADSCMWLVAMSNLCAQWSAFRARGDSSLSARWIIPPSFISPSLSLSLSLSFSLSPSLFFPYSGFIAGSFSESVLVMNFFRAAQPFRRLSTFRPSSTASSRGFLRAIGCSCLDRFCLHYIAASKYPRWAARRCSQAIMLIQRVSKWTDGGEW